MPSLAALHVVVSFSLNLAWPLADGVIVFFNTEDTEDTEEIFV